MNIVYTTENWCKTGLLRTGTDWQMRADMKQRTEFPLEIAATNNSPDIVI